ncbi:MAG: endolytic transglycosylase MltG [Hyphomicrobiales bacterium]|nr:endolytic transglycosylase MltG [Hyphomicrobiales bacterium]
MGKTPVAPPEKAAPRNASDASASPPARRELSVPDRAKTANLEAAAEATDQASSQTDDAAALAAALEPKRITPRSPRAALEPDHVPVPSRSPRPSRRARNPFVIVGNAIFTLLILVALVGGGAFVVGKSRFEAPGPLKEDKVVTIPPRSGMKEIAELLRQEGVIDENDLIFIGGVLALGARSELKAGEYVFQRQASVRDVLDTIVEGKVVQHQITIPEGLTSEQIVARLLDNDLLTGSIKEVPREGSLLPDSYRVTRGFTREQMIQRMRQAQERLVREVWDRRNGEVPLKTPEQLVTLASIIEKETGKPEERTRVAAVFANRLKQRMKLQSDPTIIYGLVYGKGSLGRPLSRADIQSQTPYNTYVIDGLPPGPIANPGRAAIEAAANPARTKELYFVADGTGGHAFAETYEQHQKNVGRLRALEQEQRGEPTQATPPEAPRAAPAAPAAGRGKRSANGGAPRSAGAAP